MENLKVTVNQKNALESLLYYASKSNQIKKSRQKSRLVFAAIIILLSCLFIAFNKTISITFLIVGGIAFVFFPQYLKWYLKKHFTKTTHTDEYKNLVGLEHTIIFTEEFIEIKNIKSETKYLHTNFEYISETKENFFIKLKTATILTFPKNQINNLDNLRNYFQELSNNKQITYINDESWTWK